MIDFSTPIGKKAKAMIDREYFVWLTTVDSQLRPQPRPVWFVWEDDSILIYSQAKAHKVHHLQQHPAVALTFNADEKGEEDVVVILGEARVDPQALPAGQSAAYMKKYASGIKDLGSTADEFSGEYSVAIRIKPLSLRG